MLIIGDVHGMVDQYNRLIKNSDRSIQVGDFGFAKQHEWHMKNCDPTKHQIVFGNHDDYGYLKSPHSLGNYSLTPEGIFTIRGAESIDKHHRIEGVSWWREEELNWSEANQVVESYMQLRPEIVISHDCPDSVCLQLFGYGGSFTRKLLENLFQLYQPSLWIFGHHHKSKNEVILGTRFICLNELETFEL